MIKNIIFDLGNVLINFKPGEFLNQFTNEMGKIEDFVKKVPKSKIWFDLDRGKLSVNEAFKIFLEKYPEKEELLHSFFENNKWMDMLTPIKENVEILNELKNKGYRLYILSSFIKEAFSYIQSRYEFLSLFDGAVISYQEGCIKPEKEIYRILLQRYNLNPEECIFIDDHKVILKPARQLGMNVIHYQPDTDLREELQKFSIKI
ncbi:MAG: HAD-IA family hydrolase [Candidatus Lokiarchaeota archaeon]|nr:HAD-IA family hydrolase [Candidatus Lokiarchaeota archaeon]